MIVSTKILAVSVLFLSMCAGKIERLITGGDYAKIEQYPHAMYLSMTCEDDEWSLCGGSILTQNIFLSAAHCFDGCRRSHKIIAYAGSEDIEKKPVRRSVTGFYVHAGYATWNIIHDIALGFTSAWPLGQKIKRVMLIKKYYTVKEASVAGWGIIDEENEVTTFKLKMVTQWIRPHVYCNTKEIILGAGMICASNSKTDRHRGHPSPGDSGSALVTKTGLQIGVASFKGESVDKAIYTNVTYYYHWIRRWSKELYCKHIN